jgi:hypothetical protein
MTDVHFVIPNFIDQRDRALVPPIELLRIAAREFGNHTDHKVEGLIFTANPGSTNQFHHTFYLRARVLNEYTCPLFYVTHDARLYPAKIYPAGSGRGDEQTCRNDHELSAAMNRYFGSLLTRQMVNALLAQVENSEADE